MDIIELLNDTRLNLPISRDNTVYGKLSHLQFVFKKIREYNTLISELDNRIGLLRNGFIPILIRFFEPNFPLSRGFFSWTV